ncbi:unnamed protein product [Polarella glacialis]|nr:unnamed protein product [Polarella glacialis]
MLGRNPTTKEPCVLLSPEQRAEVEEALNEAILPVRFQQLEQVLVASGGPFFCGDVLTICDLSFYVCASGILDGSYCGGIRPEVLAACPTLLELVKRVEEHPKVKEWNLKQE